MQTPMEILAAVAERVTAATALRAVAGRALTSWRDDVDPYVVVTDVSGRAPALRGDGVTIADGGLVQASLFESADDEDGARLEALVAAVDGYALPGQSYRGVVESVVRLAADGTDNVQHAVTIRYRALR